MGGEEGRRRNEWVGGGACLGRDAAVGPGHILSQSRPQVVMGPRGPAGGASGGAAAAGVRRGRGRTGRWSKCGNTRTFWPWSNNTRKIQVRPPHLLSTPCVCVCCMRARTPAVVPPLHLRPSLAPRAAHRRRLLLALVRTLQTNRTGVQEVQHRCASLPPTLTLTLTPTPPLYCVVGTTQRASPPPPYPHPPPAS